MSGMYGRRFPLSEQGMNDAKWAACNNRYNRVPTMREASELALKIVCAYLECSPEEWIENGGEPFDEFTESLLTSLSGSGSVLSQSSEGEST